MIMSDNNLNIVLEYYDAISNNRPDLAEEKYADNVTIITPLATRSGKDDVVAALKGFCSIVDKVVIRAQFFKCDQVMLAYDMLFPEPVGTLPAAGLLTLHDNKITRIELFYDAAIIESKKDDIFS
jgi:hypothetical protein